MYKTAVMVDGGFYKKRARALWGKKTGEQRADELIKYINKHMKKTDGGVKRDLYRIFYYDCRPSDADVYHPLTKRNVCFKREDTYKFANDMIDALMEKRKVALRLGRLSDVSAHFNLDYRKLNKLCNGEICLSDLNEHDFSISFVQKGVDVMLGTDISSLAYEGIVNQIILISGDSDFVPASKAARRKGIDFILDPMGNRINQDLFEHIDGLESFWREM